MLKNKKMQIINLTPHDVNILRTIHEGVQAHYGDPVQQVDTIKSSGVVRCKQETKHYGDIHGIAITETRFGEVEGLPEPKENVFYIVSRLVMAACPDRTDLLVPNEVQRDENGNITHCNSLSRN